jgi:hypothetical protein
MKPQLRGAFALQAKNLTYDRQEFDRTTAWAFIKNETPDNTTRKRANPRAGNGQAMVHCTWQDCGCCQANNRHWLVSGETKPLALDSQSQSLEARRAETPPLSMWRRRRSTTLTALGGGFGQINTPAAAVAGAILR